ncbi:transposase [Rhizobium gallicum]|uniref:transposase n=1 Tax=Rhizobium gallicum TaxID=56730 RepID=UPI003AAEE3F9
MAEAFAPGAVVSEVARRFEVSNGLIYTWRRHSLVQHAEPAFVPAKLIDCASSDRSSNWPWQWTSRMT